MKLKYDFVVRDVADTKVAIAVGTDHAEFNGMIKLNATGEFVFRMLMAGHVTEEEIVTALCAAYEVTPETASPFVADFVEKLRTSGLIEA